MERKETLTSASMFTEVAPLARGSYAVAGEGDGVARGDTCSRNHCTSWTRRPRCLVTRGGAFPEGKRGMREVTYPEGAEERGRVQGALLAEGAAEHVARAMAKTARAGALITHPF